MKWLIACAALVALSFSLTVTTASAMTGADAAAACKKLRGCALAMNKDGSNIDIITPDNKYIRCENLKAQCTVPRNAPSGMKPVTGTTGGVLGR
jgi:hypothetical protein